jgi:hypothetical protein
VCKCSTIKSYPFPALPGVTKQNSFALNQQHDKALGVKIWALIFFGGGIEIIEEAASLHRMGDRKQEITTAKMTL